MILALPRILVRVRMKLIQSCSDGFTKMIEEYKYTKVVMVDLMQRYDRVMKLHKGGRQIEEVKRT